MARLKGTAEVIFDHGLGAFTEEELDRLERYCDGLPLTKGTLIGLDHGSYDDTVRVTQIASFKPEPDIMWAYQRLGNIFWELNKRSFQFDLHGFSGEPQFMVYHHFEGAHFDWHMDIGPEPRRKLSLTLQLTDPGRYEGGELQFNTGSVVTTAPKDRGVAIAFPSHQIHRVTPLTAGTRKAIVAWATGPKLR